MASRHLSDLRAAYRVGEDVVVEDLPDDAAQVIVRTARDRTYDASIRGAAATVAGLPVGTHALEAHAQTGDLVAEELFSVRENPGDDPVMGFATTFDDVSRPGVQSWLGDLRCTVVQVYDWMDDYAYPLAPQRYYEDPLGRSLDLAALRRLIDGIKANGAMAQAYAPVLAASSDFADRHDAWRLFRNDGAPQSLGGLLQIMDPSCAGWQRHWVEQYGRAADELGFDGFHLDTYGYPRAAARADGREVCVAEGYRSFVAAVRAARPSDVLSLNQVNGVPRGFTAPGRPSFRYVEVWPPNDRWRHLEGLLERSVGPGERQGETLAIYPPVWAGPRESALRTAVLTEAIATTLGANVLIWGDDHGVLSQPYYVDHERLDGEEIDAVLEWHRFALRCRDLFKDGTDTSWYELSDENASVRVSWQGPTSPEPVGGSLFARVRRGHDVVTVGLLDLTGSADGEWMAPTSQGRCAGAAVTVLVDSCNEWRASVAELGRDGGRFNAVPSTVEAVREGDGLRFSIPLRGGWSVLRVTRKDAS